METPELTPEQIERGCRIEDGKIVCPAKNQMDADVMDGTTSIRLGDQKIKSVRCHENKRTNELDCTVQSTAKN